MSRCDGILLQLYGNIQGLDRISNILVVPGGVFRGPRDLTDRKPQRGVLDVSGGLVVASQEAHRGAAGTVLGSGVYL